MELSKYFEVKRGGGGRGGGRVILSTVI